MKETRIRVYHAGKLVEDRVDTEPAQPEQPEPPTLNQAEPHEGDTLWMPFEFVENDGGSQFPWAVNINGLKRWFSRPIRWHVGENLPVPSEILDLKEKVQKLELEVENILSNFNEAVKEIARRQGQLDDTQKQLQRAKVSRRHLASRLIDIGDQLLQLGREFGKKENEQ